MDNAKVICHAVKTVLFTHFDFEKGLEIYGDGLSKTSSFITTTHNHQSPERREQEILISFAGPNKR